MGYYIRLTDAAFRIKQENLNEGYHLLCDLNRHEELKFGGRWGVKTAPKPADSRSVAASPDRWFSWMEWNYDETCHNLGEILEQLGYEMSWAGEPNDSDINGIWCDEHPIGADKYFFDALAPVVEDGSFLEFQGEDGCAWRYVFDHGRMRQLEGVLEFF